MPIQNWIIVVLCLGLPVLIAVFAMLYIKALVSLNAAGWALQMKFYQMWFHLFAVPFVLCLTAFFWLIGLWNASDLGWVCLILLVEAVVVTAFTVITHTAACSILYSREPAVLDRIASDPQLRELAVKDFRWFRWLYICFCGGPSCTAHRTRVQPARTVD
jgi:hypothetical protein